MIGRRLSDQRTPRRTPTGYTAWLSTLETSLVRLESVRASGAVSKVKELRRFTERLRGAQRELAVLTKASDEDARRRAGAIVAAAVKSWWRRRRTTRRRRRQPLQRLSANVTKAKGVREKAWNRAASARVAAAERRRAESDARAKQLREELTGGGWCGAAVKPDWKTKDDKIQARIQRKGTKKKPPAAAETKEDAPSAEALVAKWLTSAKDDACAREYEIVLNALRSSAKQPEKAPEKKVSLDEARQMLKSAVEQLLAGQAGVEVEVERLDQLVRSHPEYIAEQAAAMKRWNDDNRQANVDALRVVRSAVPVDILAGGWTPASLAEKLGRKPQLARRILTKRVLWLTRCAPARIAKTHIVELRGTYDASGLDLVEARAVFACLPSTWDNDAEGAKAAWARALRDRLVDLQSTGRPPRASCWTDFEAAFDPEADFWEPPTEKSGLDDAKARTHKELDDLRAARRRLGTPSKKPFVVKLNSTRKTATKQSRVKRAKFIDFPKLAAQPNTARPALANALVDQLKAKLKSRQDDGHRDDPCPSTTSSVVATQASAGLPVPPPQQQQPVARDDDDDDDGILL